MKAITCRSFGSPDVLELREVTRLRPGDPVFGTGDGTLAERVAVDGASGGVGTFAVQLAKALGADVTPCVERAYPLGEAADALRHLGQGHARGKLVVTVEPR